MAPHGGAGSYPKGPGPSRKRPKKAVGATGTAGMAGPSPPPQAKIVELNLTPLWAHFGFARTSLLGRLIRLSIYPRDVLSTRRRPPDAIVFRHVQRLSTASSTTFSFDASPAA